MCSHVMIGTNGMTWPKSFYDAFIGAMGGKPGVQDARGRLIYVHRGGCLLITKRIDGEPATFANGGTIGFAVDSPEEVQTWHTAGVENGGTAIEKAPGERQGSSGSLYLAYLRDPNANKLRALQDAGMNGVGE